VTLLMYVGWLLDVSHGSAERSLTDVGARLMVRASMCSSDTADK